MKNRPEILDGQFVEGVELAAINLGKTATGVVLVKGDKELFIGNMYPGSKFNHITVGRTASKSGEKVDTPLE